MSVDPTLHEQLSDSIREAVKMATARVKRATTLCEEAQRRTEDAVRKWMHRILDEKAYVETSEKEVAATDAAEQAATVELAQAKRILDTVHRMVHKELGLRS